MKYLLIAVIVALVAVAFADEHVLKLSDAQRANARTYSNECMEKEDVTKDTVNQLKKGNFEDIDEKGKNFINCFLEKTGIFKDGAPQQDVFKAKLTPLVGEDEVNTINTKCNGLKGDTHGETAFKVYQCYYNSHAGIL